MEFVASGEMYRLYSSEPGESVCGNHFAVTDAETLSYKDVYYNEVGKDGTWRRAAIIDWFQRSTTYRTSSA